MKLTLAFSPCPNDTFIFSALVNNKIDTEGLEFDVVMNDVESLNEMALLQQIDITKLSYYAYAFVSQHYILLTSGSALGKGCGPMLISKDEIPLGKLEYCVIGIPGRFTTANLLFSLAFPHAITKKEIIFSEIEDELLNDHIDAGVIIQENRFTYQQKGLMKIIDLGDYWEQSYNLPIPLGAIAIKRNIDDEVKIKVNRLIKESIEYAYKNHASAMEYVKQHAQEMDEHIMNQHIALYVNNFSLELGDQGKNAVKKLYEIAIVNKLISSITTPLFVDDR